MEMWDEGSIWRFSNTGTQAARFFCCWRSEKLFPVISHLVTSRTNILLLLAPAAVVVFFPLFPPQTDGARALIILPPVLKEVACVVPLQNDPCAPVTHFMPPSLTLRPHHSLYPVSSLEEAEGIRWRLLTACSLMSCGDALQKPHLCQGSPFVSEVSLQKREEVKRVSFAPFASTRTRDFWSCFLCTLNPE